MNTPNPYESPREAPTEIAPQTLRWRVIPTALCLIVGGLGLVSGTILGTMVAYSLAQGSRVVHLGEVLAGIAFHMSAGIALLIAGRNYWRGNWVWALGATAVALVVIPTFLQWLVKG